MFFVAIICVTIIWEAMIEAATLGAMISVAIICRVIEAATLEAMIEAATLSAMISVAIILGASVKAVWMIVCEECGPQSRQRG